MMHQKYSLLSETRYPIKLGSRGPLESRSRKTKYCHSKLEHTALRVLQTERETEYLNESLEKPEICITETQAADAFPWFEHWCPAAPVSSLDPNRPTHISMMGLDLVVWNSDGTSSGWHCFEDMCPHRLAPLSEGRVENGQLHCAYHGWQFNSKGSCMKIPQIADAEKHANSCSSSRCSVRNYPVNVSQGLLWILPLPGPMGEAAAAAKPSPGVPELEEAAKNVWYQRTGWFVRDLPLRFDTAMENILDPSHVPFAHHGVQGNRKKVVHREMHIIDQKVTKDVGFKIVNEPPQSSATTLKTASADTQHLTQDSAQIKSTSKSGANDAKNTGFKSNFGFQPPFLVSYEVGSFGAMKVLATPTKPGWSRMFVSFLGRHDAKLPWFLKALIMLKEGNPAIEHALARHPVLDGDTYMLHLEERKLLARGNNWSREYFMPANADTGVIAWRRWLRDFGGEVPTLRATDVMPDAMPREQVLDRYHQHTKNCKDCQQAVKITDILSGICLAVAALSTIIFISKLTTVMSIAAQPHSTTLVTALMSVLQQPSSGLAVALVVVGIFTWRALQRFRRNFFFTDYVHAFK
ncbi:hypothetical protein CEUSTIGMA_g3494.t1 [Chlamydomonas eustigma]|uniref:Rieske domain-containing protein n=1 Tax=Chlamydomonas eustigma TaxID=1157962 RepID=A0A250WYZ4_9CHLO|nr:hypothetical protein CEUSTIGMA_g3494.t1 [Chlamydomonas eustigma]|eukprot:GAX76051.1 hypothetical protein CEUSTIGMA_g3494.t1 [Chlamydomonas eustigma]